MPALRTIGLVIMAALTATVGAIGYFSFQSISAGRGAREALLAVGTACEEVIASGGVREVETTVPIGFSMTLADNQISIDGLKYPPKGFPVRFSENLRLEAGKHKLSIGLTADGLVVSWML